MFTCKDSVHLLIDFLDGDMSEDEQRHLREHLQGCPPCVDFLKTYKATPGAVSEGAREADAGGVELAVDRVPPLEDEVVDVNLKNLSFPELEQALAPHGATRRSALKVFAAVFAHRLGSIEEIASAPQVPRGAAAAIRVAGRAPLAGDRRAAEGGGRVREVPVRVSARRARRGGADPDLRREVHRLHQLAGRLRARVRLLHDREDGVQAQPQDLGDRRPGAADPRRGGSPGARRRLHGDGRAAAELLGDRPRRRHPLPPGRPGDLEQEHHVLHRRHRAADPQVRARGPPVPARLQRHLGDPREAARGAPGREDAPAARRSSRRSASTPPSGRSAR